MSLLQNITNKKKNIIKRNRLFSRNKILLPIIHIIDETQTMLNIYIK